MVESSAVTLSLIISLMLVWFIAVNKKLEQIFIILHMNDFLAILIVLLA